MRQLSDILIEKSKSVGGKAALGRLLGGISGSGILQYTQGRMPSFEIAINWKRAFNENLIDILFADEEPAKVAEPAQTYGDQGRYIEALEELNQCRREKEIIMGEMMKLKELTIECKENPRKGKEKK